MDLPHVLLAPHMHIGLFWFLFGGVEIWLTLLLLPFMLAFGFIGFLFSGKK